MRKIQTLASMLIGLAAAHAEVIVVDANDGPGTDFTSLSAAIAAAKNGDVLLMRSGTYDGIFSILDKAIAIIADDGADVVVTSTALTQVIDATIQVSGTPPGTVLLRGLTLASDPPASTAFARPALTVQHNGASAHVFLEGCIVTASTGGGLLIEGGAPTTITHCSGQGPDGRLSTLGADVQPVAGVRLNDYKTTIFASSFRGGDGRDGVLTSSGLQPATQGEAGVRVASAFWPYDVLSDSTFEGGSGGDGLKVGATCLAPAKGGPGIRVVAGSAHFAQAVGSGGAPGAPVPSCGQTAAAGDAVSVGFLGQTPTPLPGQPGRAIAPPPRREGEATTITVEGPPSHAAFLLVGYAPTRVFSGQLSGVLATIPSSILALGNLPPSGAIPLPTHAPALPVGVESAMAFLQPITQAPSTSQATLGAPSVLVVLDAGL